MATLVFSIETVGELWEALDSETQTRLTDWISRVEAKEEEKEMMRKRVEARLVFSPLTASVAAVCFYDLERARGGVYYVGEEDVVFEEQAFVFKSRTEQELLEDFWQGIEHYDTCVTFNGQRFGAPFLSIRSAIRGIRPTRNLMEGKYLSQQRTTRHVDLFDTFTYFGSVRQKPSLHALARAFGVTEHHYTHYTSGDVAELFQMKKFRDIGRVSADTVMTTIALYKKWKKYLSFENEQDCFEVE